MSDPMGALVLAVLLAATAAQAAGDGEPATWRVVDDVDGVRVWAAERPGEFWGLARGRVDAPADAIFRRVSDFEGLPRVYPWLDAVHVLERGENSALVYFHYRLPWPLSDRSYIAAHHWWTEPSGTIVLDVEEPPGLAEPDDGAVHVERVLTRMTFAPASDGAATDVEYLFRADLAGFLPRAVRAQTAWKIPLNAVLSMRHSLDPRYASR
jgi:hypothetical protein